MFSLQKSRQSKSAVCSYRFVQPVIKAQGELYGTSMGGVTTYTSILVNLTTWCEHTTWKD